MSINSREVIEILDDEVPDREVIEILDDEVPDREVIDRYIELDINMGVNYIRNRDIDIYVTNSESFNVVFEVNY